MAPKLRALFKKILDALVDSDYFQLQPASTKSPDTKYFNLTNPDYNVILLFPYGRIIGEAILEYELLL